MTKVAVVLFNLGGPDKPEAVQPFLFNLFNDPAIIRLPGLLRTFIASLISKKRAVTAQAIYAHMGGRSPILENTEAQAQALQRLLNHGGDAEYQCFVSMRYWHPFTEETLVQVKRYNPDEILLLPLYPQYSTTTSASSLKAWAKAAQRAGLKAKTKSICCYPDQAGFIHAMAVAVENAARDAAAKYPDAAPRILFSAHGLPEKIVKAGDPYAWQCEQTVKALVAALEQRLGSAFDYTLCYQSRVGPLKWIGPATEDEVKRAGADKAPVVMAPIAFVSEHSETLVELDIEYRKLAEESGVPFYSCVKTVGISPAFIKGLGGLVQKALTQNGACISDAADGGRICPPGFKGCCREKA
jgi:ferrochelatase